MVFREGSKQVFHGFNPGDKPCSVRVPFKTDISSRILEASRIATSSSDT